MLHGINLYASVMKVHPNRGRSSMYRSVDIIICLAISGRQMDQLVVALTVEARSMVRGPPMPAAAAVKVCHGGTFY